MTRQISQTHQPRLVPPSVVVFALGLFALLCAGGCSFKFSINYGPSANYQQSTSSTSADSLKSVTVSDAEGLLKAIASNTTIFLQPGEYVLSDVPSSVRTFNVRRSGSFDGTEYSVHNVQRLRLVGIGEPGRVRVIVSPKYSYVLTFIDSHDVRIRNITFGHGPESGYCEGGVLKFVRSKDVHLADLDLFGCGTYGLWLEHTKSLTAQNLLIRECTYGIMQIHHSDKITFNDCHFRDNEGWDMLTVSDSTNVAFNRCHIVDNTADTEVLKPTMFEVARSNHISLTDCTIAGNTATALVNPPGELTLNNVELLDNQWTGEQK